MTTSPSIVDKIIENVDLGLRTLFNVYQISLRENPALNIEESRLASNEKTHSAGLMRINHSGEVSAQALYQGQALFARSPEVKQKMKQAADEEIDHLVWCHQRITELGSHTSYLNPLWYTGSLVLGAVAGLAGDKWSLGFVAETEKQVVEHLNKHMTSLPAADAKSRAIVEQMREDEGHHATVALEAGAVKLPRPIQLGMQAMSRVMTTLAYWV